MARKPQKVLISWVLEESGATGQVMFDCSVNEQHTESAQVTEKNVEKGESAADHIRPMPGRLTLEEIVTNTPLDVPETQADGVTGSVQDQTVQVGDQQVKFSAFKFDGEFDRVRDVHGNLVDAIQAGALFTITTTLRRYESYALQNYSVPRNVMLGATLRPTMEFRHINIVETQTVTALPPKKQTKKRGAKTGKELDPKKDELKRSFLQSVIKLFSSSGGGG